MRKFTKPTLIFLVALFAISTGYDFYRGYHGAKSIEGGIVNVVFGLVILAFFWWLFSHRDSA